MSASAVSFRADSVVLWGAPLVARFALAPVCLRALRISLAFGLGCSIPRSAVAATALPGAVLRVSSSKAAASCPNEQAVAAELIRRLPARRSSREGLDLNVRLDAEGRAFTASIDVGGRRQGERKLSAEGPSCAALRDVLVVSLLLLLDDDAESDPPVAPPQLAPPPVQLWLTAGVAATRGLPSGWSSAWYADVALRRPAWDITLGGLWAPSRELDFAPGAVTIHTLGARLGACYVTQRSEWRFGGCLHGVLASLRGQGQAFTSNTTAHRLWYLVGLGPELRWAPSPRLSLGISAQLLLSPEEQTFAIRGIPGAAYHSDRWVEWLGADLSARIW